MNVERVLLSVMLVAYGELLATACTACSQYAATVLCCHALTETMLVYATTIVWLKCSFHFVLRYLFSLFCAIRSAKVLHNFELRKKKAHFSLKNM